MQAVIIAGGKGTRLRPLTERSPKPMLPILDRPFLTWMVERCREAGVTDILMNIHYQAAQIESYFGTGEAWGVQIRYIQEHSPLDTAGAMKLAEPYFSGAPLIVFNADILTDLDLNALMQAHQDTQAKATLALARVADPTAFGLVELADPKNPHSATQPVVAFREKPTAEEAAALGINTINAGTYILNPEVFLAYEARQPLSFERTVFPNLLRDQKPVTGLIWAGYWMDLGTPAKYYQGQLDILQGQMPWRFETSIQKPIPQVWVSPSATIHADAQLAGPSFIGEQVRLGAGAVIPAGTIVGAHSFIDHPLTPGMYPPGTLVV
ncbi:NTP transferase domain-containing protein [Synechococcales cyanobacterium C]|uniref:NTP transferase domain-containing protein n=1 Tax=Petrachloros mirabilis ULC683 TaxID=2781853 RepID=A0A8K1ZYA1_9CYAN|nr:NDP-sugar synthase [Petrachloros mirabilis]NCJ06331.1 NTP transferase domain-containing protein [Petrachloros mirabilis ULC683]